MCHATFCPFLSLVDGRSTWLNSSFPWPLQKRGKKIDRFDNLPQFHWEDISCQDVVGQGTSGAVFISRYRPEESKPAETVVINPAFRDSPF